MTHKHGIKYLTKIEFLHKLFKESIDSGSIDEALKVLYKMRIIHGELINKFKLIIDTDPETQFKSSCLFSVIIIINTKILEAESIIDKYSNIKQKQSDEMPLFNGLQNAVEFDEESFDKNIPTLMFFYNPQCSACATTKPEWDSLIKNILIKFETTGKLFNIIEINLSDKNNDKLSTMFNIEAIPTLIMMEPSNKTEAEHTRLIGLANKTKITQFIKDSYIKFGN